MLRQGPGIGRYPQCGHRLSRRASSRHLGPGTTGALLFAPHNSRSDPTIPRHGGTAMSGVIIIREMVGTSPRSWSDAARQAVATASRTVRNIQTVEVVKSTAVVEDGEIVEYRVDLKIGFEYEG